jgi:hypothetical protein
MRVRRAADGILMQSDNGMMGRLVGGALVILGGGLQLERAESAPAQPVPTYTPSPASEGATERWW